MKESSERTYIEEQVVTTGLFFIKEGKQIVRIAHNKRSAEKELAEYRKMRAKEVAAEKRMKL